MYQFTQKLDNWPDYDVFGASITTTLTPGDYHSIELPFVFDHQWPPVVHAFGPREQHLSDAMTRYWTNMAAYGSPNGRLDGLIAWPVYDRETELHMVLEYPNSIAAHLMSTTCDFWDSHYPKYYFD
jgi:carboxylesterase type B